MLAKLCYWKTYPGETLKNKKGTQNATNGVTYLLYYKVIQNKAICYSKIKLSANEIVLKSASINPLKNSGIRNLKQPSYL